MNRIKQPSTWAGFGVLFQALKAVKPEYGPVFDGLSFLAGSLAGVLNEKGAAQA